MGTQVGRKPEAGTAMRVGEIREGSPEWCEWVFAKVNLRMPLGRNSPLQLPWSMHPWKLLSPFSSPPLPMPSLLECPASGRECVNFFLPVGIHRWTGFNIWFNIQEKGQGSTRQSTMYRCILCILVVNKSNGSKG